MMRAGFRRYGVLVCRAFFGWVLFLSALPAWAGDWPQIHGPDRNGTARDEALAVHWPPSGPPVLWKRAVGAGFAGPAAAEGRVFLFHRVGNEERLEVLNAADGKTEWAAGYPTAYRDRFGFDSGPRGVPAVAGSHVVTFGAEGQLQCADWKNRAVLWRVDTAKDYASDAGFFGRACSPLIEGNRVIVQIGGSQSRGLVAFDLQTGKQVWAAVDDEAGYASPVAATLWGRRCIAAFMRTGLWIVEAETGRQVFHVRWRAREHASVNAATPLVIDSQIFVSTSYSTGAIFLDAAENPPREIRKGEGILSSHFTTAVHRDGFLYGFDGRQETGQNLRCVEWQTGQVKWMQEPMPAGSLLIAGNHLVILDETGRVSLAEVSSEKFKLLAQAKVLDPGARAYPALAGGILFARDEKTLTAVDLRPAPSAIPEKPAP